MMHDLILVLVGANLGLGFGIATYLFGSTS